MSAAMALEVREVYAGYAGSDIVKGVSLELRAGEIHTLIGPNGCGKSTLVKALAGLLRPRRGAILLNGRDITELDAPQRTTAGLGYVPQEFNVFRNMSVRENLRVATEFLRGTSRRDRMGRIDETLARFPDLAPRLADLAGNLSGGQRQMLAFGCALMARPAVLLLDEPSAGLSPKYTAEIFAVIARVREQGIAVLVVEQNIAAALRVSVTCIVMGGGQVRLRAPAADVLTMRDIHSLYLGEGALVEPDTAHVSAVAA